MNKLSILLLSAFCAFAGVAAAQDTNSLRTSLGLFEARTGSVIVRGFAQVGSISTGAAEISVRCKETTDIASGQKLYGLAFEFEAGNAFPRDRVLLDVEEIVPLLDALNYVIKSNYEITTDKVTTLTSYEVSYTTKAGLRVMAHSIRRQGSVEYALQACSTPKIPLSAVQMTQLYNLIEQAQKNLDDLKAGK